MFDTFGVSKKLTQKSQKFTENPFNLLNPWF